eukprot:2627848-Rhodomonas_salina.1
MSGVDTGNAAFRCEARSRGGSAGSSSDSIHQVQCALARVYAMSGADISSAARLWKQRAKDAAEVWLPADEVIAKVPTCPLPGTDLTPTCL